MEPMDPLDPNGEQPSKKQLPTPKELVEMMLAAAGLVEDLSLADDKIRDEIERLLQRLANSGEQIGALGNQLRSMYAPAAVREAVRQSQESRAAFDRAVQGSVERLHHAVATSLRPLWLSMLGAAFVTLLLGSGLAVAAWKFVPSLDQVRDRNAFIEEFSRDYAWYQGKWWLRLQTGQREKLCVGNHESCGIYALPARQPAGQ